jgi:hypothetical protein
MNQSKEAKETTLKKFFLCLKRPVIKEIEVKNRKTKNVVFGKQKALPEDDKRKIVRNQRILSRVARSSPFLAPREEGAARLHFLLVRVVPGQRRARLDDHG